MKVVSMDTGYVLKFKRRREGKTDYKFRYHILLSKKPRLVVRKTNKRIIAQIIEYNPEGDRTLVYFSSDMLKDIGIDVYPKNRMAAYLTGYVIGMIAKEKSITDLVLDIGLHKHHPKGRIYSVLKGVLEHDLNIPHGESILPDDDLIFKIGKRDYSKDKDKFFKKIDDNKDIILGKKKSGMKTKKAKK